MRENAPPCPHHSIFKKPWNPRVFCEHSEPRALATSSPRWQLACPVLGHWLSYLISLQQPCERRRGSQAQRSQMILYISSFSVCITLQVVIVHTRGAAVVSRVLPSSRFLLDGLLLKEGAFLIPGLVLHSFCSYLGPPNRPGVLRLSSAASVWPTLETPFFLGSSRVGASGAAAGGKGGLSSG